MSIESEEIYLKDYFKILIDGKLIIGLFFLIFIIIGFIYNLFSLKTYKVDIWIEVGKVKNNLIEEPNQIIRKIKENIYGECSCNGELEAIVANKTDLIQVKIKTKNPEIAKLFLNNLGSYIVFNHNKIIDQEKSFIDERIKKIGKEINLWENGKKLFDVNIINPTYRLGSFFTKSKIEDKKREIEDLQFSLLGINETKIIKESNIIINSRINKILLNIIIFGLIGLFFGIFLVFGKQLII